MNRSPFCMGTSLKGTAFILGIALFGVSTIRAATPTYSIEVTEVNSVPVPNGPVNRVTVSPGDTLTAELFIKDWSPGGEKLRAFQITIDADSFAKGTSGRVAPIGFEEAEQNDANAFVDVLDPDFVHHGLKTVALTDTASRRYRWVSVLLEPDKAPLSKQDGKKYLCGTLRLQASPDASGTFEIALMEEEVFSAIQDALGQIVSPMAYERLTVEVSTKGAWRRIVASQPPDGAIDARIPGNKSGPWTKFELTFSGDAAGMTAEDFEINDGRPSSPKVKNLSGNGSTVSLELDRGIQANAWTSISHKSGGGRIWVASLPGDVNADGIVDASDVMLLTDAMNGTKTLPGYRTDLDGDGKLDSKDLLRLIEIVAESAKSRPRPLKRS